MSKWKKPKPEPVKPLEPEPVEAPSAIVGALPDVKPKNPLDCPEAVCDKPINHVGPHGPAET